jgi:transposase InsO family protein
MKAVRLVLAGQGIREVARHFGYPPGTISKWMKRAESLPANAHIIPTRSSRPHAHPKELARDIQDAIVAYRKKYHRGAEVLQELLRRDGIAVSLSSIKRTFKRNGLVYPSPWKKWHTYPPRPLPEKPGLLMQIDTIHEGAPQNRLYLYTLLDVCSRWAYAIPCMRIGAGPSVAFMHEAQRIAPFDFHIIQSDHGSEFSKWFTKCMCTAGMAHRHSRIRTPNDNAHLERFNRTIQDECLSRVSRSLKSWHKEIPEYLKWYNEQRPHLALQIKSPLDIIHEVFPRS